MKKRVYVIFLVAALFTVYFPFGSSEVYEGYANGREIVNSSMTMTPIFLNSTQDKYLQFRFYDSRNNETIPHVSFFLNVTKDGQKLMYDLFHTESGITKLKFEPGGAIGNWTVKAGREPISLGLMNNTGSIAVYSPIFVEKGLYHIHVEMLGAFSDKEVFQSWAIPKFDSYVTVGDYSGPYIPFKPNIPSLYKQEFQQVYNNNNLPHEIHSWLFVLFLLAQGTVSMPNYNEEINLNDPLRMPNWITKTVGFWVNGEISDDEIIQEIQYLIDAKIIKDDRIR